MAKILIIEDDPAVLKVISLIVQSEGHTTDEAEDTKSARNLLKRSLPELILLDISLPDENGIEFCQYLKSKKKYSNIPVIVISGYLGMTTFLATSDFTANEYLQKPFKRHQILKLLKKYLSKFT